MTREYARTHPWITFGLDLTLLGAPAWMNLGEIRSKVDHVRQALLRPDMAQEMYEVFLTKGALATTAIEGNTMTEEEARAVLRSELELPESRKYQEQELRNIVVAFNEIKSEVMAGADTRLSVEKLRSFNEMVLRDLEVADEVVPGEIRTHSVTVGGRYRGAPAQDCEYLLEKLCEWLNGDTFKADHPSWEEPMAVLKAIMAHLYIAWIHPFGDGNGRTARLVELQILLAQSFPVPVGHLLSNHYNETRPKYGAELARASAASDPVPFIRYALQGLVDGLEMQLERIWAQQYSDRWEQFIYESFGGATGPSAHRRLRLVLALSREPGGEAQIGQLRRLTAELVELYVGKTSKTVTRDINALVELGLIERRGGRLVRAKQEQIIAFRAHSRAPEETE